MRLTTNPGPTHKLTISGIVMALYVVIMLITQSFAFMQYQIRIATALYGLGAIFPFLTLPLGLANMLSNILMGGLGLPDAVGGLIAGLLTTGLTALIGKQKWHDALVALPILLIPGLLVPVWLSYLLNIPYIALAPSVLAGQVLPAIVGALMVIVLKQRVLKEAA